MTLCLGPLGPRFSRVRNYRLSPQSLAVLVFWFTGVCLIIPLVVSPSLVSQADKPLYAEVKYI